MTRAPARFHQISFKLSVSKVVLYAGLTLLGCEKNARLEAQRFIDAYTESYVRLKYQSSLAEWQSYTTSNPDSITLASRAQSTKEALMAFIGNVNTINICRNLLEREESLTNLQKKQLEIILFQAAKNPQSHPDLIAALRAAEIAHNKDLAAFMPNLAEEPPSSQAWEASKKTRRVLGTRLADLRSYRNNMVRTVGYEDYFTYQASEYGLTSAELLKLTRKIDRQIRPLYQQIHTYIRYQLAKKFNVNVPDLIPAHWLPDRTGHDWSPLIDTQSINPDKGMAEKGAEWIMEQAERFFISMGFPALPAHFYERSSLFPIHNNGAFIRNHSSIWHLDLDQDVRAAMNIEANTYWYKASHHELGRIYYFLQYANPQTPILLRRGANRAFHEAIGLLMELAAMQPRLLVEQGLSTEGGSVDPIQRMLEMALKYVVLIPWAAGVITEFEYQLYVEELPLNRWNDVWWDLKEKHQGIISPKKQYAGPFDPEFRTELNISAARNYDRALSIILLFQFHDFITKKLLMETPAEANYFGRKEVGDYLKSIMRQGAAGGWQKLLRETTGKDLSTQPMMDYFRPLHEWLRKQNEALKSRVNFKHVMH